MANYATLKAAIADVIKTNGNNAITGAILQQSLLSMIDSLGAGYQYKGIATPTTNPGTPDQKVFYIASTPGTYSNFGGIRLGQNDVAILRYDSGWTKETTGIAAANATGVQNILFGIASGQVHSSQLDQVPVNIKTGDKFTIEYASDATYLYDLAIFAYYEDGTSADIGSTVVGTRKTFVATKNISRLGVYIGSALADGVVSLIVTYSYALIANEANDGLNALKANAMVLCDHLSGSNYNLSHNKAAKKVSVNANGIRVFLFGKQIGIVGPYEMEYTSSQNGAFVLDRNALISVADGGTLTLSASNAYYAATGSNAIKNNIILFPVYFGTLIYSGVFGQMLGFNDFVRNSKLSEQVAVAALNGTTRNIIIDKTNKVVRIKKEGFRLVCRNARYQISGDADFEMSFSSDNQPNGAWYLKRSIVESTQNEGSIALSSANFYYASVGTPNYANDDILLFATYYEYIPPVGLFGPYLGESIDEQNIVAYGFNSPYNTTDITAKCKQYSALLNNSGPGETFLFMTDPHLLGSSNVFDEAQFKNYIGLMLKYYNMLPIDWMICGGDWLNNSDYQEIACWKLGYMDATMRKLFKNYYPILGNHDTNYQGVVSASDPSRGDLTHQTLVNLMFRQNGNTYYEWRGNNTRFFVFDTQTDWESAMDAYKWEQIDWCAQKLLSNTDAHIMILQHIYYSSGTTVAPMSQNIQSLCGAFNSRQSITLNGITYDFSGATGKIHCIIAGHSHFDEINTSSNVPVWLTTNMMDGSTPTFDLLVANYTTNQLKSVRVGTGNDRVMNLA